MAQAIAPDFEAALADLQNNLPQWWATRDEGGTLYELLVAIGESLDALAWAFEQPYLDQSITTASEEGLLRNFALAWGVESERLPPTAQQLRAYIEARAKEDGSLQSLLTTLTALLETPQNTTGGAIVKFPAGGGGLTFPTSGAGITLYEFEPGHGPKGGLIFPANGEGLRFPESPESLLSEDGRLTGATGETPPGPPGVGLTFSQNGYVSILQNTPGPYELEVETLNWLAFDRKAFQRAVERFQPAHCLPARIRELAQVEL